jgi:hypothetical protein
MIKVFGVIFLLFFYVSLPSLSAKVLQPAMIDKDRYFIQVAALSKEYNVKKIIKKLLNHDLYIQKHKNLKRIYIVNIDNKSELVGIKKLYPSAFFAKTPDFITVDEPKFNEDTQEIGQFEILSDNMIDDTVLIDEAEIVIEKMVDDPAKSDTMNSNTILKTRKSFL